MEYPEAKDVEEEISEPFLCCICLELLYKPIVLSCGHISCFWCVHKSMNSQRESHCPICRHPYNYFPSICETLHFLLKKMYPIEYKRREDHIMEEERKRDCFSPQIDSHAHESHVDEDHVEESVDSFFVAVEEKNMPQDTHSRLSEQVSIADLLCAACQQLLFRPVVLNCGHAHCEACVINPADEMLRCQVCQSLEPKGCPKVCLLLDHFLAEKFPKEYALRRDDVKQILTKHDSAATCSAKAGKQSFSSASGDPPSFLADPWLRVHAGVGCDFCGMYPIIGLRYRCKDCVEAVGFDLCGDCYNTRSKLPGRFNQQHTTEHRFELIKHNRWFRVVTEQFEGSLTAIVLSDQESSENGFHASTFSSGSQENTSSNFTAPVTNTDAELEDQNRDG